MVSGLRGLAKPKPPAPSPAPEAGEHCDLCGTSVPGDHRHMLNLHERQIVCVCESCWALRSGDAEFRPTGNRTLWLDDLRHSYVDLNDPTHLAFEYIQSFADVADAKFPGRPALDALHIGGGGFTMPRFLREVYSGSKSTVLEIDDSVVKTNRERLGLKTGPDLKVRVGDARIGIRDRPCAMSSASATRTTPASSVYGSPLRRWPITQCITSAITIVRSGSS